MASSRPCPAISVKCPRSLLRRSAKLATRCDLKPSLQQQLVKLDLVPSTWHGMRLLAVDGSQCHLPLEDVQAQFYGARLEGQQPVARLSSLYDVLNKQILDAPRCQTSCVCRSNVERPAGSWL